MEFSIAKFFLQVLEEFGFEIIKIVDSICDNITNASNDVLPPKLNMHLEEDCTPPMINVKIKIEEDANEYELIEGEDSG